MKKLIALSALTTLLAAGCASNDQSTGGTFDETSGSYGAQGTSGSINNSMDRGATNQNWNANPPSNDSSTLHDELDSTPNPSRDTDLPDR